MTKLYFMRHAETELNRQKRFAGITETNITNKGSAEARKNFPFKEDDFDIYYCSPLCRTQQTLNAILPHVDPIIDKRIIERDLGDWEGAYYQSVSDSLTEKYISGKLDPPNGETYMHLCDRVCEFVKDVFSIHRDKKVLIVTHANVLRVVRDLFLPNMKKEPIKNSQILILTENNYLSMNKEE